MCRKASLVITRDKVFWSQNTDSHTAIHDEFSLRDDSCRGVTLVNVEITPPGYGDGNEPAPGARWDAPLEEWTYRVDQDLLPEWHTKDPAKHEAAARAALVNWFAAKVVVNGYRAVSCGQLYASGSATVRAFGSATVEAFDSATVRAFGSATVRASDSATVRAFGSATVRASDSATVRASDSATVRAFDSATVRASGSANLIMYGGTCTLSHSAAGIDRRCSPPRLLTAQGEGETEGCEGE